MNNEIEVWKPVAGYEDYIMISNLGKIKHLYREYMSSENATRKLPERDTYGYRDTKGYKRTSKSINGVDQHFMIHVLVAKAFIENTNPNEFDQVNHKNGIKHDNRVENLEWTNNQGNILHSYKELNRTSFFGETKYNQENKSTPVRCPTLDINFPSVRDAANQTGISTFMIYEVCKGHVRQTSGLVFNYI